MPGRTVAVAVLVTLSAVVIGERAFLWLAARQPADATVTIQLDQPVNTFDGVNALGAGVDGLEHGEIDKVWRPDNLAAMRSAGYGPISFRLRTELGVKAWHWNAEGSFSDPGRQQGYWTSSSTVHADAGVSYGYNLPRRGNTIDQAKNDGYSRLDDGDLQTFWKSNPYLDEYFTKESNAKYPQWMLVDFPTKVPVDTVRIAWGDPHAARFRVQYWTGEDATFPIENADWQDFPAPAHAGAPGTQTVRVASAPVEVQHVRILLLESSGTAGSGSGDVRDRLGFAVRELFVGHSDGGSFVDEISHAPSQEQTRMYTSSTDPWHRASDVDRNYEHASFERTFASGLTNGQPMMVPVPVLYGIPEDAAALLRYLRSKGYPVKQIEMGEEPDGQLAQPEHYAALYLQVGKALKEVDPTIQLGGPGYQTVIPDWIHWPDGKGVKSYTGRFISHLRERNAMDMFDFFSFEWYPFDDVCGDQAAQLAEHPAMLADLMRRQEDAGLPKDIPKIITEYGYSSFAGKVELELPGSIVNSETAAQFLAIGGDVSYFYGLEPNWVFQEEEGKPCDSWGNLMLFQFYDEFQIRPVATFHALQLVTKQWVSPDGGRHTVYPAAGAVTNAKGQPLVTAYTVRRPDGRLAVMLFNKDPKRPVNVRIQLSSKGKVALPGKLDLYQYSSEQWVWYDEKAARSHGFPKKDKPPAETTVGTHLGGVVTLPPFSISVARTGPLL